MEQAWNGDGGGERGWEVKIYMRGNGGNPRVFPHERAPKRGKTRACASPTGEGKRNGGSGRSSSGR